MPHPNRVLDYRVETQPGSWRSGGVPELSQPLCAAEEVATITLNPAIDRTLSVEGLRPGEVHRVRPLGDRAGGKGVNVACALAECGRRVASLGVLGAANDALFRASFEKAGIADRMLRIPGETRMGIKILDTKNGTTTDLNAPGLAVSDQVLRSVLESVAASQARWCVLAGSLPPGVPVAFVTELVAAVHAAGMRSAVDTSGESLRAAIACRPDLLKPNSHELGEVLGRPVENLADVVGAARELVQAGVGLVAVSRGAEGVVLAHASGCVVARPPSIPVGSTVGAGDAMVAGLVEAALRGLDLADTARLATAFSLHALTRDRETSSAVDRIVAFAQRVAVILA